MPTENKKKTKNEKRQLIPVLILYVALGVAIGVISGSWTDHLEQGDLSDLVITLFMMGTGLLPLYVALILHETGHLVMGLLTGYEFVSFRIGSFTLVRENGRLVRRKFHIVGTGGQCLLTYKAVDEPQHVPYFWYHFGGAFFNFLTAILCLPVIFLTGNQFVLFAFEMLALSSVAVGLLNSLPTKAMGVGTDGYNLLLLRRSPVDRVAIYKTMRINALQYQGAQLENLPAELLTFSPEEKACTLGTALAINEAALLMYRRDFPAAEEQFRLIAADDNACTLYKNECLCEQMFCMIMNGCPPEKINRVYDKSLKKYIKTTEKYYITRKRLLYAYALAVQKDAAAAAKKYAQALEMEKTYPAKGEYLSELSLMDYVHSALT